MTIATPLSMRRNTHRLTVKFTEFLVTANDERTKWTCLKRAPRLKIDPAFQKVYLSPDLILKENGREQKVIHQA